MDKYEQKALDDIEQFGWHVMKVFDSDGKLPNFAYSIGLYKNFHHPEIVMIGLDLNKLHKFINSVGEEIRAGKKFEINTKYSQFTDNYDTQFCLVDKSNYKEYFGWALWYYKGEDFPVMQFVWTDKNNHFPWEKEFDENLRSLQPLLGVH